MFENKEIEENHKMRIFNNDTLEFLSKCHYSIPFVLFIPVVILFFLKSISLGLSFPMSIIIFILAFLAWTLFEYFAHANLLHTFSRKLGMKNFLQKSHTRHHDFPHDNTRVVLSPLVSIPGAYLFYFLFISTMGKVYGCCFFSGYVSGYLIYDLVHYNVHHKNFKWRWFQVLKRHHLMHHFKYPEKNFGLSTTIWDKLFKTVK